MHAQNRRPLATVVVALRSKLARRRARVPAPNHDRPARRPARQQRPSAIPRAAHRTLMRQTILHHLPHPTRVRRCARGKNHSSVSFSSIRASSSSSSSSSEFARRASSRASSRRVNSRAVVARTFERAKHVARLERSRSSSTVDGFRKARLQIPSRVSRVASSAREREREGETG